MRRHTQSKGKFIISIRIKNDDCQLYFRIIGLSINYINSRNWIHKAVHTDRQAYNSYKLKYLSHGMD